MGASLALARFVASGKIELDRQDVEVGDLVREAVDLVLPLVVLRRQLLVSDVSAEDLVVNVDAARITQALERLLTSVVKLSAREATLAVTTRSHAGRVVITVTSATLPEASDEELGLAYVGQLCELHDGALVTTPGQLRVMLPRQ